MNKQPKIEKILLGDMSDDDFDQHLYDMASNGQGKEFIIKKMKKYAEWYALKLKLAILKECWMDDYGNTIISECGIQDVKLPPHAETES